MPTYRKEHEYWTVVRSISAQGKLQETSCCCAEPGAWRTTCAKSAGNKTPCRCHCHTLHAPPVTRKKKRGRHE